eukprot:15354731-Ditylum_brightwellii.AAC.1
MATILLFHKNAISGVVLTKKVVGETWEEQWHDKRLMQWLQRAQAFPYTQKGRGVVGTYLGGGWGNKKDVLPVVAATVVFIVFVKK